MDQPLDRIADFQFPVIPNSQPWYCYSFANTIHPLDYFSFDVSWLCYQCQNEDPPSGVGAAESKIPRPAAVCNGADEVCTRSGSEPVCGMFTRAFTDSHLFLFVQFL